MEPNVIKTSSQRPPDIFAMVRLLLLIEKANHKEKRENLNLKILIFENTSVHTCMSMGRHVCMCLWERDRQMN